MTHDLRRYITLCEQLNDPVSLVKQVRDHYVSQYGDDLHGHCEEAVSDLADLLIKYGYQGETVNGTYAQPFHWPEGDISPVSGHSWIEVDGKILDPTREQFGSDDLVVSLHGPDAKLYQAQYRNRLDEMIVHRDRFIQQHNDRRTVIAINPTKTEWDRHFPNGAAGVLCKDGKLVIGDGNALAHDVILDLAHVPQSMEKYRLQLCRQGAWVELWLFNDDWEGQEPDEAEVRAFVLKRYGETLEQITAQLAKAVAPFSAMPVRCVPLGEDQEPLLPGDAEFIAAACA